jgi:MoaA/NifB/PqqE/SkfB family radical SAM enzyme
MRKALRLAGHFVKFRMRALHPFEVQAVLLNACNLRCLYCRCPDIKTALMTTEQWCDLVRRFAALGTHRIKFQGGEPTIRKDFAAICRAAKRAGLVTAVTSNGYGLSQEENLESLDEVVLSLDALTPALHDRYRGEGSHATVMRALDRAQARGCRVYINMVVHRDTLQELEAMLEFCEQRRIGLNAQAVMFGKEYQDDQAMFLGLSQTDEQAMYRQLADWKRQGRPLMFSAGSYDRTAAWPDYRTLTIRGDGPSSCMAGRDYIHVEPNGDVHPCGLHGARFSPKNFLRDGLEAALLHAQHHDCADCALVYLNERKALFGLRPAAVREVFRRGVAR